MLDKEKDYFEKTLSGRNYTRDTFIEGVFYFAPSGQWNELSEVQSYNAWIIKINSLCKKILLSLKNAIQYSAKLQDFNPFTDKSEDEFIAQYFIENAVYRLISLWDVLAQLTNMHFECGVPIKNVMYKRFFSNESQVAQKDINEFVLFRKRVESYISENDDTSSDGPWKGNHIYISDSIRNPLVHRNDPHEFSVLDGEVNLIDHPIFELKRIIEDFMTVNDLIDDLLKRISVEVVAYLEKYGVEE
jgi:hypothetical protein